MSNTDQRAQVQVTLNLTVSEVQAFVAAAVERAIAEGVSEEDARETYTAENLGACAVMLIDPGMSPPGSQIEDSSSEVTWDTPDDASDCVAVSAVSELDTWALTICEIAGIDVLEVAEGSSAGRWEWRLPDGKASEASFQTKEQAADDAVARRFPREDWRWEVNEDYTSRSYKDWVQYSAEQARDDLTTGASPA